MLKYRLITAAVLIPLVLLGIFKLPETGFILFIGSVVMLGAWEWIRIAGIGKLWYKIIFLSLFLLSLLLIGFNITHISVFIWTVLAVSVIWWLTVIIILRLYANGRDILANRVLIKTLIGFAILVPAYVALIGMRGDEAFGPAYVFYMLLLIWTADTAAYFSGRKWGRRKLLPRVSPGKTWEGVYGALIATSLLSLCGAIYFELPYLEFILLGVLVTLISIVGDLTESLFKRQVQIKDSSSLLPGHGGILDRIDSLTSASPFFLAGLMLIKGAA